MAIYSTDTRWEIIRQTRLISISGSYNVVENVDCSSTEMKKNKQGMFL